MLNLEDFYDYEKWDQMAITHNSIYTIILDMKVSPFINTIEYTVKVNNEVVYTCYKLREAVSEYNDFVKDLIGGINE